MYTPEFKGPIEGWVHNFTRKNLWRVEATNEWQDLMQESYVVFLKCAAAYPELDTPQHFMALYKRSWSNHIHDLAQADSRYRAVEDTAELPESGYVDGNLPTLLRQAPAEVKAVLNLFINAPAELLETALADWRGKDARTKNGGSVRLCKLLGLNPNLNVIKLVEDYLTE